VLKNLATVTGQWPILAKFTSFVRKLEVLKNITNWGLQVLEYTRSFVGSKLYKEEINTVCKG
jgi:hypothetical protein